MEAKLIRAAEMMPIPETEFGEIAAKAKKKASNTSSQRRLRPAVIVLALVVILCGVTTARAYGRLQYGAWLGWETNAWWDVQRWAGKLDLELPKEMGDSTLQSACKLYVCPSDMSFWEAVFDPSYVSVHVDYGVEIWEDGSWNRNDEIAVVFGSTEDELWKYHFSVNDEGKRELENIVPGSEYSEMYGSVTLHCCVRSYEIDGTDETITKYEVYWTDEARGVFVDVSSSDVPDAATLVAYAKTIVDLNP